MDDGRQMGRLKLLNIQAVMDDDRMTVSRREGQDGSKGSLGKNSGGIVVEAIRFVYVTRDGRKLDNSRPHRGGRAANGASAPGSIRPTQSE
jgi:hypothetical protein